MLDIKHRSVTSYGLFQKKCDNEEARLFAKAGLLGP